MRRKHFWHHQQAGTGLPWDLNQTVAGRQRVTLSLHRRPYRFRNNMVGIRSGRSSIESVRLYFERVLDVELQVEGEGREWTDLEACMRLFDKQMHLYMKQKMQWDVPEYKRLLCFLDVCSPNARTVLRSLATALCQKALFYASDVPGAAENLHHVMYEFSYKGYPTARWLPGCCTCPQDAYVTWQGLRTGRGSAKRNWPVRRP